MQEEEGAEEVYFDGDCSHFDKLLATATEEFVLQPVTIEEILTEQTSEAYCTEIRSRLNEGRGCLPI